MSESIPKSPKLVYSKSYETNLGTREVELYWGSLGELPNKNDNVLISSTVFQGPKSKVKNLGAAWKSLKEHYSLSDHAEFEVVLESSLSSKIWPVMPGEGISLEKRPTPYLSVLDLEQYDSGPRQIFCLHFWPHKKDQEELFDFHYQKALSACPLAIKLWENYTISQNKPLGSSTLVMSALAQRQIRDKNNAIDSLKQLFAELQTWFAILPQVSLIRVCYWNKEIQKKLDSQVSVDGSNSDSDDQFVSSLRKELRSYFGDKVNLEIPQKYSGLINDLKKKILVLTSSQGANIEIFRDLNNLSITLGRADLTITELGTSTGRLTESLVGDLCRRFYGHWNGNFYDGIEKLTSTKPTQARYQEIRLSKWYKSYLHTLRTLRNQAAHTNNESEQSFPKELQFGDGLVMLSSLLRVLELYHDLIVTKNASN
jgi:hypothetical protein